MKKKVTKKDIEKFVAFLEKAVASENCKKNDPEKWKKYKEKLDKERLKLKLL